MRHSRYFRKNIITLRTFPSGPKMPAPLSRKNIQSRNMPDEAERKMKMTDQEKLQYINYMAMKEELDNVAYGGIELKLDGMYSSSHSIASVCVFQEEHEYMRDYRRDETGHVTELDFESVDELPAGPSRGL